MRSNLPARSQMVIYILPPPPPNLKINLPQRRRRFLSQRHDYLIRSYSHRGAWLWGHFSFQNSIIPFNSLWWVISFERAMREWARAKYFVAIFVPVLECDDNFCCWSKEILKMSHVNEVGPVWYNNFESVLHHAQITLNKIDYVLSLIENTLTTLISRHPGNWR